MNCKASIVLAFWVALFGTTLNARAGTASADNLVIAAGPITYRIQHMTLTDTPLDDATLGALLSAKNVQSLADRFASITAGAIAMPEVVAETKRDAMTETVIYRDVKLSDVKAGHVGAITIAGATLAAVTPKLDDLHGTIGAMKAADVDLALLARMATTARTDPAEPRKPLYGSYAVESFAVSSAKSGFELTVGPITGSGAKGRALETPLTALGTELAPQPGEAQAATRARVTHVMIDLLGSVELGSFEAKSLVVRSTQPDKPASVSLARLAVTDAGSEKIGGVSFENFMLTTPQVGVHVASLSVQNIDLTAFRRALAAAGTGGARAMLQGPQSATGETVLSDLSAEVAAKGTGNSDDGQHLGFHIDRISGTSARPAAPGPLEFDSGIDHFVMAMPARPDSALKSIVDMGYAKLDLSSRSAIAWDDAHKQIQFKTISLTGAGMGTITLSADLGNVSPELFSSDPAVVQAAALGLLLNRIDLRIENAGLIDKLFALQARNDNKSVDDVRKAYVTGAGVAVPVMLGNGPGAKAIGAALAKFAAQPRSFHLVATAPNGLGASDLEALGDPAALLAKLNISASANE